MFIISFFRDVLDGWVYVLYVIICVFLIFSLIGIVGDRKRKLIHDKLLEKKERDIASGAEAEKAAMADKQVLDVMEDEPPEEEKKTEEVPQVLVIGGDDSENK